MNIAVILASGMGKRMGAGKNKVLLPLNKRPIIFYTLKAFEKAKEIDGILLVVGEGDMKAFRQIVEKYHIKKVLDVIVGGAERQDSGHNGVKFLDETIENKKDLILLFHNGANPFVTQAEIFESIREARKWGASVVAHKTKDTIRQVNEKGISLGVLERSKLWNMQTPQTIKFSLAKKAFEKANMEKFLGTDDVSLVERLGRKVKIIEASMNNFKITTPFDLELAKLILKNENY